MPRRIPVLPTLIVLAAVAAMIWLGVWQLHRKAWKEALLARYDAAMANPAETPWPKSSAAAEAHLYRRSRLFCASVRQISELAGRNAANQPGIAHAATCRLPDGEEALVVIGWSDNPAPVDWRGGREVTGVIAPGPKLVADPPLAGLQANARPDASGIPNNHLSYAVQWFLFAATAVVIYILALRKRWRQ
jgi:cytochrome oxidase assembly protein ShyY1